MKKIFMLMPLMLLAANVLFAQGVKSKTGADLLTKAQTDQLLTPAIKKSLGIEYTIFRTYKYTDKSGTYYIVLTESRDKVTKDDTINKNIHAFNFKSNPAGLTKVWEMKDFIIPDDKKNDNEESTIWFFTNYCLFKDLNGDGLVDPVIVYGTLGLNGREDGRVKILLYYKAKKYALRRQNSTLDDFRKVEADAAFSGIPAVFMKTVSAIDDQIEKDQNN